MSFNITGSVTEKQFFHTCKVATESGLALHVNNASSFWTTVAPKLAILENNEAMKHALIALGATYHLTKVMDTGARASKMLSPKNRFPVEELETFILRQYTLAINHLRERLISSNGHPDNSYVALACCLVFICIENLRFNHHGAIAHFRHAIQIIQNSFNVKQLYRQHFLSSRPHITTTSSGGNRIFSDQDAWEMISIYRQLEITEGLFSDDIPLNLLTILYSASSYDDGSDLPDHFTTLEEGYRARVKLNTDAIALNQEGSRHPGDARLFWESPDLVKRHFCLQQRRLAIMHKYDVDLAPRWASALGTRECASYWMDVLQLHLMTLILALMPVRHKCYPDPNFDHIIDTILDMMEQSQLAISSFVKKTNSPFDFAVGGFIPPLYLIYMNTVDPKQKSRILKFFAEYEVLEGPWDGRAIAKILVASNDATAEDSTDGNPVQYKGIVWMNWVENQSFSATFHKKLQK